MENRRAFTRIPFQFQVKLSFEGGSLECKAQNLSLNGLRLEAPRALESGTTCTISMKLGEEESPLELTVRGRVVRCDGQQMGLHFVEVELDSFHHLRNLILYNAEEPESVEEEFSSSLGLKRES